MPALTVSRTGGPAAAPVGVAGLVFSSDDEPGFRRRGRTRTWLVDDAGSVVRDAEVLARVRSLAIPPAWTDVWVCADPNGHVQATGRDAKGRKQYRYHPDFRAHREEAKFQLLVRYGRALPAVRRRVATDLTLAGLPRDRVLALVVALLERTLVRVGNEEYARANRSYGLTTLRDQHVRVEATSLRLRFRGKHARLHRLELDDPRLARLVRRCQDLPGQLLFQYVADDGSVCPVRSTDVNAYLREASGLPQATAKTFRTWSATLFAAVGLGTLPPPATRREGQRNVTELLAIIARELGNTPAVARRSYVHPDVVLSYLDGSLRGRWEATTARGSRWLSPDERRLLDLLAGLAAGGRATGPADEAVPA